MKANEIWRISGLIIWIAVVILFGVGFYVNWYLPHGPSYPTGNTVCQNEGMGPCGEEYKEDTRGLNIPNWAKFFRTSESELLLIVLIIAGMIASAQSKKDNKNEN